MLVHPGVPALLHILKECVGGHGEDGDDPAQRIFAAADALGGFEAIHDGHLHVHQDHVVLAGLDAGESVHDLLTVGADGAARTLGLQQQLQNFGVDGVVLGAEEVHPGQGRDGLGLLRESRRRLHLVRLGVDGKFQHDLKAGALAGGALHPDGAAHQVYDALGDGHAEARALHLVGAGFLLPGKGVEEGLLVGRAHADAVILHDEPVFGVVLGMGKLVHRQPDVSALGRILDRIGEDVHQHLIQTVGVGQHVFVLHMGLHRKGLAALAGLLPDNAVQLADLLGNVHFFDVQGGLAALDAAHVQNIVDDAQQQPTGSFQLAQMFGQPFRLVQLVFHQGSNADDGVHGGADVVGHIGEEVRLGFAGLFGYFQCGFHSQRGLVLARAVGHIHDALSCALHIIEEAGHMEIARLTGLLIDKFTFPFLLDALFHLHQTFQPRCTAVVSGRV